MALIKPSWLEGALSHLNWDILTWHVYVGDAVESAIDWVLGWIDSLAEWAAQIVAWWEDFRQEVVDFFTLVSNWFNEVWQWILNFADTLGDWIANWWESTRVMVLDWIDTAVAWVSDRVDDLSHIVDTMGIWWENFTTVILPELASKFDITKAFDDFMLTWGDLFEGWEVFKDAFIEFFTNPLEWLWLQFTDWFLGKEK
jgi:hypothetical protein